MKTVSFSSESKAALEESKQVVKAASLLPVAELRETLAGVNENIQYLGKAIITAGQIEEAETARYKPFFVACCTGNYYLASSLLATGLDVNYAIMDGFTALHLAAANDHTVIVRFLLEQGAKVDPRVGESQQFGIYRISLCGATPWFLAKANQKGFSTATADLLSSYGADINAKTDSGMTSQEAWKHIRKTGFLTINVI